jgi:HNH endonuclease
MDRALLQLISRRALDRCEYCHLPQAGHEERFSVDHVVPRKHGGDDSANNLAFSCLRCNLGKGSNLTGIDSSSNQVTPLFNPRVQTWRDHFRWNGPILVGITPTGRVTVAVMLMNSPERVRLWQMLLLEGAIKIE